MRGVFSNSIPADTRWIISYKPLKIRFESSNYAGWDRKVNAEQSNKKSLAVEEDTNFLMFQACQEWIGIEVNGVLF